MAVYNIDGQMIDENPMLIDVKTFGAKGDGITDDYQSIQNALTYCLTYNRTLYFSEGTYLLKTDDTYDHGINISQSVKITGAGMGKAILKADSSFLGSMHVINIVDANNVWLSDFTIDGGVTSQTRPNASGGHAIRIGNSQNITIKNMELCNTGHYGIGQQAGSSQNVVINNVHIHDTGGDGIDFKNFSDTNAGLIIDTAIIHDIGLSQSNQVAIDIRCKGAILSNVFIDLAGDGSSGIRARATTELQGTGGVDININNVTIKGASGNTGEGIGINTIGAKVCNAHVENMGIGYHVINKDDDTTGERSSYSHFTNCSAEGCYSNEVLLESDGVTFENCSIKNSVTGTNAIALSGTGSHRFIGCAFADCGTLFSIGNNIDKLILIGCIAANITTQATGKTSAITKTDCVGLS